MMRCSRPMSCAVGSTPCSGGRRTHELAAGGVVHVRGDVRLPAHDDLGGERRRGRRAARSAAQRGERLEVDPGRRAVGSRLSAREVRRAALGDRGDALRGSRRSRGVAAAPRAPARSRSRTWSARSPRIVSRIESSASGADAAISARERVRGALRSSSAATSRSASPMRSASSPRTSTAVYMSSSARCWPTTAGSVTEMPKPWWNPSLAKLQLKRVSGDATRKSARATRPEPATHRGALHRGDDRLAVREEARRLLVEAWRCRRGGRCRSGRRRRRSSFPRSTARRRGTRVRRRAPSTASASSVITVDVEPVVGRAVDLDRRDVVGEVDGDGRLGCSSPRTLLRRTPVRLAGGCRRLHESLTLPGVS